MSHSTKRKRISGDGNRADHAPSNSLGSKVFSRCFENFVFAVLDFAADAPTFSAFHERFAGTENSAAR
ncbi:MAG: hypothetical protein AAF735_07385 [Myxococcota bacterium]